KIISRLAAVFANKLAALLLLLQWWWSIVRRRVRQMAMVVVMISADFRTELSLQYLSSAYRKRYLRRQ
ncbi:MAG: hypothetical protein QWI73_06895, partial [Alphaproteobacteria bacterium]|nr:hypothetical protein [Alphaproteobacteria bacterium]